MTALDTNMNETIARPWYREFWVWFVMGIVGMGVVSGTSVLLIGISNAPQMVTGDYQPLGKVLIDTRERAEEAQRLGLSASLSMNGRFVDLTLAADRVSELPDQLLLQFQHSTNAARDVSAVAQRVDADRWQANVGGLELPLRSRVILSDLQQSWWLAGRFNGDAVGQIGLDPERL
jgi:hypothetical protein